MQFYKPVFLIFYVLLFLFFFYGLTMFKKRQKQWYNFISEDAAKKMNVNFNKKHYKRKLYLACIILMLFITALAQPQWGMKKENINRKGYNLIFLLDVSKSMIANDMLPDRFTVAKNKIRKMIIDFPGNKVALIAFSGIAKLMCPLTIDYSSFNLFLDSVENDFMNIRGTSLDEALKLAASLFTEKSDNNIVIVFSDGEDFSVGFVNALKQINEIDAKIYAIGIGTDKGGYLFADRNKKSYLKDEKGDIIISRLNSEILKEITEKTKGVYIRGRADNKDIELLIKHIKENQKGALKDFKLVRKEDHYQSFLIVAIILYILFLFF